MSKQNTVDKRNQRTLTRLEALIDGVYAFVIVLVVIDFPRPDDGDLLDLGQFLSMQLQHIVVAGVGLLVVFIYWIQSNALCGYLKRTDNRHAVAMVLQLFFVLFYLYVVGLAIDLKPDPVLLALQSIGALLIGVAAAAGWWYASGNPNLLDTDTSIEEVDALRLRVLAEPLTALLTLFLAFVGPIAWELGWLAYPVLARLLRKTRLFPDHH